MTKQEIFNKVWHALTAQGSAARSTTRRLTPSSPFACEYLTEDGRKCAVGHLLPDGHPAQSSSMAVMELIREHPDLIELLVPSDGTALFLDSLQRAHDHTPNANFVAGFQARMRDVARMYGLTVPE